MKKFFSILLALVATLFISCTKEMDNLQAPTNSHVVFKAKVTNNPLSKVTITPNDGDTVFSSAWEDSDKVNLYAVSTSFDEEAQADWNPITQAFEGDFVADAPAVKEAWQYKAKFPYDDDGDIPFGSVREQKGNAYNSAYDIMYGTAEFSSAFLGQDNSGNVFVIPMKRLTGIAYFHITGGSSSDDVLSATLTVNSGNIAAETVAINGAGDAVTPTNGSNSITINFQSGYRPKADDIKIWFNVLPGTYSGMQLTIKTASKTASIASNKSMTYTAGELNKVVLSGLTWVNSGSHSITWDSASDWNVDLVEGLGIEDGDYRVELHKAGAGTAPIISSTDKDARVYAGGTATVSYSGYAMSKIVFNISTQGKKRLAPISASTGTIATQSSGDETVVWTGKANEVTFTVGATADYGSDGSSKAGQLDFSSIDVETVDDGLADPEISYASDSYTALSNKAFVAPTLTNPNDVTVTYSSTDTDVATVNATTGAITVIDEGETTIKATFAGDATYRAAIASYTLTVADPSIVASSTTPAKAGYADNSTVTFTVDANCTWEAEAGTDDDSIIKSVSSVGNTVTVTFNANAEESEKTATVNLNQTGADSSPISVPVTVTQSAKPGAAAEGATIWTESWDGLDANDTPSAGTTSMYGGGYATYSYNPERSTVYTKIYTSGGPGTDNNLLISYSTRSDEYWSVTGIPTSGWASFTLTYTSNTNKISLTGTSGVSFTDLSVDGNTYTKRVDVTGSPSTFGITFTNTQASSNARIDDISVVAGAPAPGITVTTNAATSTASAEGTTATLNGELALVNGAENSSVTEAGFYYKLTSAGSYTKVTCDVAPISTTTFSYNLTGLTKDSEYTFYAYAVYDSGSEVTGETETFTPTQSGGGSGEDEPITTTYTFTSKAWADSQSAWTSGKDGNQLTSGRGVQVTTGTSGANATTKSSLSNVSEVVVTYSTNQSAGAGNIVVKIGSNTAHTQSVTNTGGTTDRTLTYTISPNESGTVNVSVTCTTNSIYVKSVAITHK